jgi:hypothetical protein
MNKKRNADIPSICEVVYGKKINQLVKGDGRERDEGCYYSNNSLWLPMEELINMEWKKDTSNQALEWANN